jgi:hypothetical protein
MQNRGSNWFFYISNKDIGLRDLKRVRDLDFLLRLRCKDSKFNIQEIKKIIISCQDRFGVIYSCADFSRPNWIT